MAFEQYEGRWDLLEVKQRNAPILLPAHFRDLALEEVVGFQQGNEWRQEPVWRAWD
jgi:hypothetical protein